jgi:hypothetical protein
MDIFRQFQKLHSLNGGKTEHVHGCPCCRKYKNISKQKKYAKKMARVFLRNFDYKNLF